MRFLVATFVLSGCATGGTGSTAEDLRKRLDEALRRQAQAEKKLESLEDRVFLLTDQLESQKVAAARTPAPRLPVVTLHPREGDEPEPEVRELPLTRESPVRDKIADGSGSWFDDGKKVRHVVSPSKAPRPASGDSLGVAPVPQIPAAPVAPAVARDGEDPMKAYRVAYEELRAGREDAAALKFREFVRRWPRHDLSDNAQYWLGEAFYARKRYAEAAVEFRATVDKFPLGNKAPDALVKLGFCLQAMGEPRAARDVLGQVGQSYPRTDAARLAEVRLAELSHPTEEKP